MTRETITVQDAPGVVVSLERPDDWTVEKGQSAPAFLALQPAEGAGPFRDNLLVSLEVLPEDFPEDIAAVQQVSLAQAHATVPDHHVIDDRAMDVGGLPGWFRAAVYSTEGMTTVVVRQLFALHSRTLVTIALTSLPFRDAEASAVFEDVASTCTIDTDGGSGT